MESTRKGVIEQTNAAKITQAFNRARQQGRGTFIAYFMSGYPSAEQSVKLVLAAAEAGADIVELGMPFSDPLADGATVQYAGQIALEQGMTIQGCMEIAKKVSAQSDIALVLMGYYNPIIAYGIERFCAAASSSGVSGLIIPDLPQEESAPLQEAAQRHGLALIFLIPPTTPDERIARIITQAAQEPRGFVYCVSLSGVTGSRKEMPAHLHDFVARVRKYTGEKGLPIAVGFGITTPEHIRQVTSIADGAVVGSAIINLIDQHEESGQVEAVRNYIRSLSQA